MHIEMLDLHINANGNNTLELYKWFNTEWSTDVYFVDFETKCREQALHCDFPITLDKTIIIMTVAKPETSSFGMKSFRKMET